MNGRVLVLDDEPDLREIYSDALADVGLTVRTSADPRAALATVREGGVDVVVSDITMPVMSGVDFLGAVHEQDPDLPVILVTGNPTLETAMKAIENGAVQYLLKPVRASQLTAAVEHALKLRRMATLRQQALSYLRTTGAMPAGDGVADSFARALDSLWMAYQPILRATDGSLYGFEALMRTREEAFPDPGSLFEAAEQLGRVVELGRAIRAEIAKSLHLLGPDVTLFVNLHPLDLGDELLLSPAGPLAARARNIVLEITERSSLEGIRDYRARVKAARELGFRIAVDDLGAGYAGLTSFAALEPEVVKLDIALVRGVSTEPMKHKLIDSMCSLCKDLGILVVAEGIENLPDQEAVTRLGCDLLQGFLLGRPTPGLHFTRSAS